MSRQSIRPERKCEHCGAKVSAPKRGAMGRWCSKRCKSYVRRSVVGTTWDCQQCGANFAGHKRRFCGAKCRDRFHNVHAKKFTLVCVRCGKGFVGAKGVKTCSPECFSNLRANPSTKKKKKCWLCGRKYLTPWMHSRYCSKACACRAVCKRQNLARRQSRQQRKKIIACGDAISPSEVFARDGWRCQLCNKKVLPLAKAPHPLSPVVDHIVPISPFRKGDAPGTHTWDNVQCAHLLCNARRQNRGHAQRRWF